MRSPSAVQISTPSPRSNAPSTALTPAASRLLFPSRSARLPPPPLRPPPAAAARARMGRAARQLLDLGVDPLHPPDEARLLVEAGGGGVEAAGVCQQRQQGGVRGGRPP